LAENKLEHFSGGWKKVQFFKPKSGKKCLFHSKMAGNRSDFNQKDWDSFFWEAWSPWSIM